MLSVSKVVGLLQYLTKKNMAIFILKKFGETPFLS